MSLDVGRVAVLSVRLLEGGDQTGTRVIAWRTVDTSAVGSSAAPASPPPIVAPPPTSSPIVDTVPLAAPVVAWTTSNPSVATVNGKGVVTAVAPGTATVTASTAKADTAATPATLTVTVTPPAAPATAGATQVAVGSGTAELPRATVDVTLPTMSGHSIIVNSGGDLQAALNAASLGDEILLQAGATFTGNYTLPVKSGTGWLVISTTGTLPSAGVRVHPSDAAQMARIVAADPSSPAFQTAAGAHNYRLVGLEITAAPGATNGYSLVTLGDGSSAQNTAAQVPHDLILDRTYVHGTSTLNFQRCIALNSGSAAVVDSYISECHAKGMDAQAIAGWNGPGPYRIENDYLEGSGENVMFGGADPSVQGQLPRDITIRHNYFLKPPSWKGVWEAKNLLEFKIAQRVLVEGNVFENSWADAQVGTAIVMGSTDQGGSAPWSETSDVTFRNNIVKNVAQGFSISATPNPGVSVPANHIAILNNVIERVGSDGDYGGGAGRIFELAGIQGGLTIQHNTALTTHNYSFVLSGARKIQQLVVSDNIFGAGDGIIDNADGLGFGTAALNASADSGWVFRRNVVVGVPAATNPTDNFYPATATSVGLDAGFNLPSGSSYLNVATDGTAAGANIGTVNAATAGVTQ